MAAQNILMHVWITRGGRWLYFGTMDHARLVGFVDASLPDVAAESGLPVENVYYFVMPIGSFPSS